MDSEQIKYLGDVQRLELKPGDRLVLTAKEILSSHQYELIREQLKALVPGHDVIVLSAGMKLEVLPQ